MLIGVIFKNVKAPPTLMLGLGWFLAALLPVLNIAPVINEYSLILTPEHFLYLPIVGVLILVVIAGEHLIKHFKKFILGLAVFSCLILTWHQNTFWSSEVVLFERMLTFEPNFGRGHLLLAKAYYFNGRPRAAEGHFGKAYAIISGYAHKATNIKARTFYLSITKETLFDWAQNESAMGQWRAALAKYDQALLIDNKDASLYNNIAFVDVHLGDKAAAKENLEQALRIDPGFIQAQRNLAQLNHP